MRQKNIFLKEEADAWYERNKPSIQGKDIEQDPIFMALKKVDCRPKKILEIGCANGWRLAKLAEYYGADCYGIDPSSMAIKEGQQQYPELHLTVGSADCLPNRDSVDLIIFGFCLYLCDPQDLFEIAANSDSLLSDQGTLAILDFNPIAENYRNEYEHHDNVFSYKMNYSKMFCWHPSYYKVFEHIQHHNGSQELEPDALISVQIVKKDSRLLSAQNPYNAWPI